MTSESSGLVFADSLANPRRTNQAAAQQDRPSTYIGLSEDFTSSLHLFLPQQSRLAVQQNGRHFGTSAVLHHVPRY